jgi:hypothetical protein
VGTVVLRGQGPILAAYMRAVVPHLSIGPIDQLAENFPAVRQFQQFDQLDRN